ncbi:PREDICTED: uncharacterized protein LOC103091002 [Lipotes vexillifer]|uniref:Uncharacterized protein LOC103091002 n=1 Tax=Lipotes vexillifer TaxID=118797 RepID=A0A340WW60_LIPVE|nr:PREDICTED: uncharacterized protein LOC103091002 [Lipotes vexillifer]
MLDQVECGKEGNGICPILTGSWAEVVLTQPRSVSGSLEQKVTISCTRSSGNIGSYYVHSTRAVHPPPVAYLTISGLQPEDKANYYCQSGYDSNKDTALQTHGEGWGCLLVETQLLCPLWAGQGLLLNEPSADLSWSSGWNRGLRCGKQIYMSSASSLRPLKEIRDVWAAQLQFRCLRRAAFTMAWTPLLLMLLSHCTGALSQPVLTQPSSLSSYLGASARLTCTLNSGFNVGNFWIRWYQQKPGNPPRYLLTFHSDSDKHQGSGVPSRLSGSNDASTNAGTLLISGLQPEDEADYYCATYHGNSKAFTVLQTMGK